MSVAYEDLQFRTDERARTIDASFRLVNRSREAWESSGGYALGWQLFDPDTNTFISEGEWQPLTPEISPASGRDVQVSLSLPPERGRYHVYISPVQADQGWMYSAGNPFVLVEAEVEGGKARFISGASATLGSLRRRGLWRSAVKAFTLPVSTLWRNRALIGSMVRRDIMARYRGSFGDVLWTVLNPLLLMLTYFFVFGVVLQSRFGADQSRTGFALYFLAGMLPWLAISEAIGRAPHVIVEHRNFVKKLIFPVETLPVNQVIAGLVTQAFALAVFLAALLLTRGSVPATILWLPVLLVPQLLMTMGFSWFLAALGVYLRDLGQVIGFALTLVFFLTPICYPESSLPPEAAILTSSPIYALVRGYRAILLEGQAPEMASLLKVSVFSASIWILGHACFHKLRKSFADVV